MASEEMGMVPHERFGKGPSQHSQLLFPGPVHQRTAAGEPGPATTRQLTGFIGHNHNPNYFRQFHRSICEEDRPNWSVSSRPSNTPSGDGYEDDYVDDDEDDDEDDSNANANSNSDKLDNCSNSSGKLGNQKPKPYSAFGLKEGDIGQGGNEGNSGVRRINGVGVETCFSKYIQGAEGSNAAGQELAVVENGCGFSGRKEGCYSGESGESLRTILSDPLTGALMDDAMILPCGHSFGSGGMQFITKTRACYTCSRPLSDDSAAPNFSLRMAVQAFRREEELWINRAPKRRRERYDLDKGNYDDVGLADHPRGRGVQFPFAVMDRVVIKGNKRTPERFVGREAVVTTQCLNGWYVVKTLDNAESVKLQYRSLTKAPDCSSSTLLPAKTVPNWL